MPALPLQCIVGASSQLHQFLRGNIPKPRHDRRPNWSLPEMLALVDAKCEEFIEELDVVDGWDLMDS